MTTDLYKTVIWSDGEGLTHGDFNDAQRFLSARVNDGLLEKLVPGLWTSSGYGPILGDLDVGAQNTTDVSTLYAYCLNGGQAFPVAGSAANKVKITPGTLFQKVGTADGSEPSFLSYTFDGTEEVTLANGNGSNPRIDIIQMKLEYVEGDAQVRDFQDAVTQTVTTQSFDKKRQVQCTLSLKQGTAGANPVYPTPDAGYVMVAGVFVGTGETWGTPVWNMVFNSHMQDQRIPLKVTAYRVPWTNWHLEQNWAQSAGYSAAEPTNATNKAIAFCPVINAGARILGVGFDYVGTIAAGTIQLGYCTGPQNAWAQCTPMNDLTYQVGSFNAYMVDHFTSFQTNPAGSVGNTVVANADGFGPPVWCGGSRSVLERSVLGAYAEKLTTPCVMFQNITSGIDFGCVVFYVAEGI